MSKRVAHSHVSHRSVEEVAFLILRQVALVKGQKHNRPRNGRVDSSSLGIVPPPPLMGRATFVFAVLPTLHLCREEAHGNSPRRGVEFDVLLRPLHFLELESLALVADV